MHLSFLIPLVTGLASSYIFLNSAEEMEYLAGSVALISMILTLIVAPWQFQLLVLVLVLTSTRRLLRQLDCRLKLEQKDDQPKP